MSKKNKKLNPSEYKQYIEDKQKEYQVAKNQLDTYLKKYSKSKKI